MILVIALWTLLLANTAAEGFLWKCALIGESYDIRHTRCTCLETGYFECHQIFKAEFTSRKEAILPSLAKIILRRRYDTPPPLTTSTKGTTNSPPPYTTQTPPNPHTTDAPTEPVTHGAATVNYHTRSPPPPKAVLG